MSTTIASRDLKAIVDQEDITGAKTLDASDTNKTFKLNAAAGAAINAASIPAGFKAKFITALAFATTDWVITLPATSGQGGAIVNSVYVPAAGETTITIAAAAETVGDWIEIEYDGTNTYINGIFATAAAASFA